jgi:hypothetical protein
MRILMRNCNPLLSGTLAFGAALAVCAGPLQAAQQDAPPSQMAGPPPSAPLPPDQLQQLVAPIALYPDNLVAQILAASAYPAQVVEAERFLEEHPKWHDKKLGKEVDKQDWDPSVKALTQFPDVLSDMNKDLSWTSELGDANVNQQQAVMQAIQTMRQKARAAGHLSTSPQENVTDDGSDIAIAPANPDVVYVPEYNPDYAYGYPVGLWPGFDPWWGDDDSYMSFGMGIGIDPFFGYGWGWGGWGMDWRHGGMMYGGGRYNMQSRSFYDRNAFMRGNYRGVGSYNRGDRSLRGFGGGRAGNYGGFARGGQTHGFAGSRSGAFGGTRFGGESRGFSSRGMSSMRGGFGGGGGFRGGGGFGGGGGFHGGGGGGGFHGGGGGGRR